MTYRSILTYVDGDAASAGRLSAACDVARQFDAHLTTVAVGYDINAPADGYGGAASSVIAELMAQAQASADERLAEAKEQMSRAGIRGDAVPLICRGPALSREIGRHAQFADMAVMSRPYGDQVPPSAGDAFEGALFESDAAVLLSPPGHAPVDAERVVIAWNISREALRAVRRAMPYLQAAKAVEIMMVESYQNEPDPGERLAKMLSRHGINTEIVIQPPSAEPISKLLQRRLVEFGAGLLVMGGYGHSRLREYVLGGVTRDILRESATPVLMAH